MDQLKLRTLVFEKTGVKVDVDDPIFALVALNEAVLEEAVERHLERIEAASLELAQHARNAGGLPAPPTPTAAGPARPIATQGGMFSPRELRLLIGAGAVAVLTALLMLAGQAMLAKPAAAPILLPAPLTASQMAAIAAGEKLERILPKLDAKTRSAVEAELNKP
jgi:hypothetical protein